ncbi:MAG: VRR-NUC domain-containing protein [Mesorhizobium sp.]|uniref:VRR-NUC domain-containing protein n=1 Tax=Mesorhizobium sp. TaxID=1871066 RepID=UPI000FE8476F|nr:VRR-NUC domain-containing protein [Mesorhizobium sp.]RWC57891.1 MAG: VRR-NUC domain-containing protein [Mesorhizobium sp.]
MTQASTCLHANIACLNEHELIRKYRCAGCDAVMMCACDEAFGRRFLAHQLEEGVELLSQKRLSVTHGFQSAVCNRCRGLPLQPAPAAAIYGRSSKIKRFYWRELFFRETERFGDWEEGNPEALEAEAKAERQRIQREVLEEIKTLHQTAPLYDMREPSQADVLTRYKVEVQSFHPTYAENAERGAVVVLEGEIVSPEAFVAKQYELQGWTAMALESVPLHALFSVMMWLLIEHPSDERNRMAGFGSRSAFENGIPAEMIWIQLPEDFGTPAYGRRRKEAIDEHIDFFLKPDGFAQRGHLLELFDYWRGASGRLRQYLWAHRDADVDRARKLIELLPPEKIVTILRYLVADYWNHYLGWPDLLLWRGEDYLFVEVKSSSDRLSADQMRWIADNHEQLKLPFGVVKLHRPSRQIP